MKTKKNAFFMLFAIIGAGMFFLPSFANAAANQWEAVGSGGFSAGETEYNNIVFNPSTKEPYVAYEDVANSSKATVKRFHNSAWETVGSAGFSAGAAYDVSLAFNSAGDPYVAYEDGEYSDKITVAKLSGSEWVTVGDLAGLGFSDGAVQYVSLAFNPTTNYPYVAYQDDGHSDKATVMKFNGTSWEDVGSEGGFSDGEAQYVSLAFNPLTYEPYVAYQDGNDSDKATVMKLNGTTWEVVGNKAGFSDGDVQDVSLAFNSAGEPYVAYQDGNDSDKATVMKLNGTTWEAVGSAGFSAGDIQYTSLAFNPSTNYPYVAYKDGGNSDKATVMKFNGTSWEAVGSVGFGTSDLSYTSLAFNPTTYEPYVAYADGSSNKATVMKFNSNEVADPVASPAAGTYTSAQSVTLSTTTAGATIYYTTDGSTPTAASAQYSSPIPISSSVTLKAIAIKSSMTDSSVFSGSYTIEEESSSGSKDTVAPKRTISNSPKKVARGSILVQRGKKFSKNSIVQLYFSKSGGGYYAPSAIKTSKTGTFAVSYRVTKPIGTYSWYAFDTKAGKKSKIAKYTVK